MPWKFRHTLKDISVWKLDIFLRFAPEEDDSFTKYGLRLDAGIRHSELEAGLV